MKKTFPRLTASPSPVPQGGDTQNASGAAQDGRALQFKISAGPLGATLAEFDLD